MEDRAISDAPQPTQDGGKCSDTKVFLLPMKEARSCKFKVILIRKIGTLKSKTRTIKLVNNGILSTLMNGRENQEKENLTRSLDFMLKETSMLSPNCQTIDILI
jgi:hypothetical protein